MIKMRYQKRRPKDGFVLYVLENSMWKMFLAVVHELRKKNHFYSMRQSVEGASTKTVWCVWWNWRAILNEELLILTPCC